MRAWRRAKKAHLYIGQLDAIIDPRLESIGPLVIGPLEVIGLLKSTIGQLEFIIDTLDLVGLLESIIGPLESIIGPLESIDQVAIGPLEFSIDTLGFVGPLESIDQVAIGPLDAICLLDSRKTDHVVVLGIPWSHDVLVAANNHDMNVHGHDALTLPVFALVRFGKVRLRRPLRAPAQCPRRKPK